MCLSTLWFHCRGWLRGAGQVTLLVWQVRWINTCAGETFPLKLWGKKLNQFFQLLFSTVCSYISEIDIRFLVRLSSDQCLEIMLWSPHGKDGKRDFHGKDLSAFMSPNSRWRLLVTLLVFCLLLEISFIKSFKLKGLIHYLYPPEWHIWIFSDLARQPTLLDHSKIVSNRAAKTPPKKA